MEGILKMRMRGVMQIRRLELDRIFFFPFLYSFFFFFFFDLFFFFFFFFFFYNFFFFFFFFFNDTATTEIYTLSLHDALPIRRSFRCTSTDAKLLAAMRSGGSGSWETATRSEEHTSELQSHLNLVCRLLL